MSKMCCGIPNAYILDITMYKMHVSFCSYCIIRILISKSLLLLCKLSFIQCEKDYIDSIHEQEAAQEQQTS